MRVWRPVEVALIAGTVILAVVRQADACNVPVFRYALENWQPDSYQVLVAARDPLSAEQQQWVARLQGSDASDQPKPNLQVRMIDLGQSSLSDQLPAALLQNPITKQNVGVLEEWLGRQSLDQPQLLVLYPQIWDRLAWHGDLTAEHVQLLIDSPLRQEIASRLLSGQSAVWVLLECGDTQRDEQAWQTLQSELVRTSRSVELPDRELIESDEFFRPEVPIELRVEFSAVRLAASDAREQVFASLLRGSEADLRDFSEPIAIPIYGRGRTYFALVGNGINGRTIEDTGRFLCGACSCQVKDDNPGLDMLLAVDWGGRIQGTATPPVVIPELTGIGGLDVATQVAAAAPAAETTTEPSSAGEPAETIVARVQPPAASAVHPPAALPPTRAARNDGRFAGRLVLGIGGGLAVAVALLGLATFWLRRAI